jgi:hypothetical protein
MLARQLEQPVAEALALVLLDERPAPWRRGLLADSSSMAILPGQLEVLKAVLEQMHGLLASAYATSTNKVDAGHFKAWSEVCAELGTLAWRVDVAANSGLDPVGHHRELVLLALAFTRLYAKMSPRSRRDPAPKPQSAMAKL